MITIQWHTYTTLHTGSSVELTPSTSEDTSVVATVQSTDSGVNVGDFDVIFSIKSNDCVDPTVSVTYEEIDFSYAAGEFFDVLNNDGSLITRCSGDQDGNCNVWETCTDGTSLGVSKIDADTSYTIKIQTGDHFHVLCSSSHAFSFNARVRLTCGIATESGNLSKFVSYFW